MSTQRSSDTSRSDAVIAAAIHDAPGRDPGEPQHRPWPVPARPWVMAQTWHDLLCYCLYAHDRQGHVWRGEIDHAPWPLQHAEADLRFDSLTAQHVIRLPDTPPLLHFARHLTMHAWTLDRVT